MTPPDLNNSLQRAELAKLEAEQAVLVTDKEIKEQELAMHERHWLKRPSYLAIVTPAIVALLGFAAAYLSGVFDKEQEKLEADKKELVNDNNALSAQKQQLVNEQVGLEIAIQKLEQQRDQMRTRETIGQMHLSHLHTDLKTAQGDLDNTRTNLERAKQDNASLNKKADTLITQTQTLEAERKRLAGILKEKQAEIAGLSQSIEKLHEASTQLERAKKTAIEKALSASADLVLSNLCFAWNHSKGGLSEDARQRIHGGNDAASAELKRRLEEIQEQLRTLMAEPIAQGDGWSITAGHLHAEFGGKASPGAFALRAELLGESPDRLANKYHQWVARLEALVREALQAPIVAPPLKRSPRTSPAPKAAKTPE